MLDIFPVKDTFINILLLFNITLDNGRMIAQSGYIDTIYSTLLTFFRTQKVGHLCIYTQEMFFQL